MNRPLAITTGEPAGIGPDLIIELAQRSRHCDWVVVADPELLLARAKILRQPLQVRVIPAPGSSRRRKVKASRDAGVLSVLSVPLKKAVEPGRPNPANAAYVLNTLDAAVEGCLNQQFAALITGPVQKSVINEAGISFTGHTEYFAGKCGVEKVVMLLVADLLRVALVTTHLPLARVAENITRTNVRASLEILLRGLSEQFGLNKPRILVAGLNPHAGEGGHLGREEIDVIEPVCQALRDLGADVRGPLPADTLFTEPFLSSADAVLAMYHDQGLPVLKSRGFGHAVNVTLGLPIIRTSVDHGTALDLAGSGQAHTGSFAAALDLAEQLASRVEAQALLRDDRIKDHS